MLIEFFLNVYIFSFIIVIYFSNLLVHKYKLKIELEIYSLEYRWRNFSLISQIN